MSSTSGTCASAKTFTAISSPNARSFSSTPSFGHTLDEPEKLLGLYALTNRIRLTASPPVLAEAEHLLSHIADQYFARNLTVEEMRQLARSKSADPLKAFGEACRAELKSIRARL